MWYPHMVRVNLLGKAQNHIYSLLDPKYLYMINIQAESHRPIFETNFQNKETLGCTVYVNLRDSYSLKTMCSYLTILS